jgi:hypothetical protein
MKTPTLTELYIEYANYVTLARNRLNITKAEYGAILRPSQPIHYNIVRKYERAGYRAVSVGKLQAWYDRVQAYERSLSESSVA